MMKAIDVFRKLIDKVYLHVSFTNRRKKLEVGALVKGLSVEERQILSELKSDDLSEGKVVTEEVKLFAYDEYHEKYKYDIISREEKLKFDKFILKE